MKSKTKTTTTLALATMPEIKPKPTKTEVLNAFVARAKVKHDAENERRAKIAEGIDEQIRAIALKEATDKFKVGDYDLYVGYSEIRITMEISNSPEIKRLRKEREKVRLFHWDEKKVRAEISDELTGRASARLLSDSETVKAIDTALDSWGF
jgi:hypothetical protein